MELQILMRSMFCVIYHFLFLLMYHFMRFISLHLSSAEQMDEQRPGMTSAKCIHFQYLIKTQHISSVFK